MLIVIVPHLGTATSKTEGDMARLAAQNVLNVLQGEKMITPAYEQ